MKLLQRTPKITKSIKVQTHKNREKKTHDHTYLCDLALTVSVHEQKEENPLYLRSTRCEEFFQTLILIHLLQNFLRP